ncbi:hypothetical protein BAUCODRAFT_74835 [Baudoinia panamericana UAMH 10762]|uniref:GPR1/FUN34/YaaH-class plasma membrane protein n=1 Tax=Baudoinia panamericana (strain UAMH 10762) TaxID=717646 RepID=M2N4S9_BAUPA|nr:uncharacterized protein BAUCODRAFT_74835 [Baudoinia panamericana UAMH 10762]EMC94004.1 hypothetical protein BAUCODRAFT_74835 [Baudoinia panamericana UAMH 10762]
MGNGADLSRQVTVTLSPADYERLFFQPSAPRRGDLAKRFANPTLLGLLGFLIPYTSTVLTLCQLSGSEPPYTLIGLSGDYYFLGCIAMNIAGICEFILGNTLPFAVFVIYGSHWGSLAYTQDPIHETTAPFAQLGGATGAAYNSSQAFHNVTMCLVSFALFIASVRTNVFFSLTFFGLLGLFAFIAAADFYVPHVKTEAQLEHVNTLLRCAGGFGFIGLICGWYLAILEACEAVGIPNKLPVLDLSSRVFAPKTNKVQKET